MQKSCNVKAGCESWLKSQTDDEPYLKRPGPDSDGGQSFAYA